MASASDIELVRRNTNELTQDTYTDTAISTMVDSEGIAGASAMIWREKAGKFAHMVNASESGASHSYSDLHKNAINMAKEWERLYDEAKIHSSRVDVVRVKKIVRS